MTQLNESQSDNTERGYPPSRTWNLGDFAMTVQVPRAFATSIKRLRRKPGGGATFVPTLQFAENPPALLAEKRDLESCVEYWKSPISVDPRPRPAPSTGSELAQRVTAMTWYHTIELPGGIVTPGVYDHRSLVPRYGLPHDLTDKRALDVATYDGFWAFELEKRGARVTAIDIPKFSDLDHPAGVRELLLEQGMESTTGHGFRLAAEALGSKVERVEASVYDLSPQDLGTFDFVHVGDLLLHLREPLRALERIRSVTAGSALIVDAVSMDMERSGRRHLMQYLGGWRGVTWWETSVHALAQMVLDAGFSDVELFGLFRLDMAFESGPWRAILKATP